MARDLNGDGKPDLVLMREASGQTFGPIVVVNDSLGVLTEGARLAQQLLPRDTGDSDGDGRMEILASGAGTAVLIESAAPDAFPQSTGRSLGFAIGFALSPGHQSFGWGDSLLVWRSTGDAAAWRAGLRQLVAPGASAGPSFLSAMSTGWPGGSGGGGRRGTSRFYQETGTGLASLMRAGLLAASTPLVAGDLDQTGGRVVADVPVALDATSEALRSPAAQALGAWR